MKTTSVGRHAIFDLEIQKTHPLLSQPDMFINSMTEACVSVGATVLNTQMHYFGTDNSGYTFTIILAESHASCHTWPEHGLATFDIFMCGDCDPFEAQRLFLEKLQLVNFKIYETKLFRGFIHD